VNRILADTSIWINHLRYDNPELTGLLVRGKIVCHPFIVGEIVCGNLKNRSEIISLLLNLPMTEVYEIEAILKFIEIHKLMGLGIGIVDIHLLMSAFTNKILIWTGDKRLGCAAEHFGIRFRGI